MNKYFAMKMLAVCLAALCLYVLSIGPASAFGYAYAMKHDSPPDGLRRLEDRLGRDYAPILWAAKTSPIVGNAVKAYDQFWFGMVNR